MESERKDDVNEEITGNDESSDTENAPSGERPECMGYE